uniref:Protein FAM134C n=1 Tax=Cacopsylla melanoneura TaxID=428564 RepID=A0A8D9EG49_9HEMI
MNRLFSTYENLVKNFHFGKTKRKNSDVITVVDLESFLKKHERRLYQVQNIVFWESPILSFGITLIVSLLFYFLSYCTWKFFASLFSILLVLCVGEVWVDRIWPEIAVESPTTDDWLPVNDRSFSAAEISQKMSLVKETLDRYWKWLINLRRDKPSIFCLSTSCILFSLILITWSISGLTLVYFSLGQTSQPVKAGSGISGQFQSDH